MNTNQIILLAINIIGGILVIGSYYFGLKTGKGADALWGGVPKKTQKIYAGSMLISALGYFCFFGYIFKGLGDGSTISPALYYFLFALMLSASALWMPLTNLMVSSPSTLKWLGIRSVLILVALASLGILISLLRVSPMPSELLYYSAVAGAFWFTFHTGVLDAIFWPVLWKK